MHVFFVVMLCVQENSVERPAMREVVQMGARCLGGEWSPSPEASRVQQQQEGKEEGVSVTGQEKRQWCRRCHKKEMLSSLEDE
ncbi:hypothetical protein OPV22_006348 [Ensete ventricosum]|uniref:Serine-threonine/tyrosine-protein kinase catalytic domain-containing protein n=1 Tax=Ensete ventricosum TaxID=4639 RepID=A0AAV8QBF0_ENSVE|nr:hypothetical protein OPV22_006348 [Ensete ventricosum]